ncbi:MAG: D-alanyl-D-alanine carboxypeptidase/D-alanyl-D-alanine endopeptidase, partial [Acidimicrobiales bacterium]
VAAGVTEVRGAVVGDESRYDSRRYVDVWPERFIVQDQTGPLSALSVNDGWIAFPPNPDTRRPDEEPAPDPAAHAAQALTQLLAARGVAVGSPARAGEAPADDTEVAAVESPRMREVVAQMLRESDNQTAELLTKELGLRTKGEGTTAAGVAAIQDEMAALGLPVTDAVVADGSGLAEAGRVTCQLVQAVLDRAGPNSPLDAALPIAGQTGTLTERFVGVPVSGRMRAKTGTLNEVTSLAGFVDTLPGARITFSFIVNLPPGERVGEDDLVLQDELAAILVGYPQGPVLADLGPKPLP